MMGTLLVTGGSRGIGAAVARLAAARGFDIALSYRGNKAAADQVVADIAAQGRKALAIQADVGVEADVARLFGDAIAAFVRIDVLVNNAGILEAQARLEDMSVERWDRVLRTNVIGTFLCAKAAVRHMSTRHGGDGGVIINLSSRASGLGSPNEFIDYAASKGAMDTMTVGLAKETARDGIRVNAVRPGLIETEMHASGGMPDRVAKLQDNVPIGRGGTADEVAEAILWLASEQSSYVTGALLDVSGGR
ncbi:MAG: SDR family oxidoreductase [Pseudomonadota bacterium]